MTNQEAIEILEERKIEPVYKAKRHIEYVEKLNTALDMAIEALWGRPKGEWIYWREDGIKRCKCSRCLTSYGCLDTPYCPNCGEKMVEGRSEE